MTVAPVELENAKLSKRCQKKCCFLIAALSVLDFDSSCGDIGSTFNVVTGVFVVITSVIVIAILFAIILQCIKRSATEDEMFVVPNQDGDVMTSVREASAVATQTRRPSSPVPIPQQFLSPPPYDQVATSGTTGGRSGVSSYEPPPEYSPRDVANSADSGFVWPLSPHVETTAVAAAAVRTVRAGDAPRSPGARDAAHHPAAAASSSRGQTGSAAVNETAVTVKPAAAAVSARNNATGESALQSPKEGTTSLSSSVDGPQVRAGR